MADWIFGAPAGMKDFAHPEAWHREMKVQAEEILRILTGLALGKNPEDVTAEEVAANAPSFAYVNPTVEEVPSSAVTVPIQAWNGFPNLVRMRGPWTEFPQDPVDGDGSYRAVEHHGEEDSRAGFFEDRNGNRLDLPVRDRQDEYLEWAARRNSDGKITKIIFVAEGYDYFSELFADNPERVAELYSEFTERKVTPDDLRAKDGVYRRSAKGGRVTVAKPGEFNPRNRFNLNPGIVHLSHRANSLSAEVNLAGVSGIARKKTSGQLLLESDSRELLCCNQGGEPNRNSDPLISAQAYRQVRDGSRYTLANPVGLYIAGVQTSGLLMPDNVTEVPREWWKVVRGDGLWGSTSRVLRLELEVPASEKKTISDLIAGGSQIKYPAQVAELLSVHLFVTVWKRQQAGVGPIVSCDGTCCQKNGSGMLVSSDGSCLPGFHLRYPDLVPSPSPVAAAQAEGEVEMSPRRWRAR